MVENLHTCLEFLIGRFVVCFLFFCFLFFFQQDSDDSRPMHCWAIASEHDQRSVRNIRDCCGMSYPPLSRIVPSSKHKGLPLRGDCAYAIIAAIITHQNTCLRNPRGNKLVYPLQNCNENADTLPLQKLMKCVAQELVSRFDQRTSQILCEWLNRNRNWNEIVENVKASYDIVDSKIFFEKPEHEKAKFHKRKGLSATVGICVIR